MVLTRCRNINAFLIANTLECHSFVCVELIAMSTSTARCTKKNSVTTTRTAYKCQSSSSWIIITIHLFCFHFRSIVQNVHGWPALALPTKATNQPLSHPPTHSHPFTEYWFSKTAIHKLHAFLWIVFFVCTRSLPQQNTGDRKMFSLKIEVVFIFMEYGIWNMDVRFFIWACFSRKIEVHSNWIQHRCDI